MLNRNKILIALSLTAIVTAAAAFEPPYGKRFENKDGSRIAALLNLDEQQQKSVQSIFQEHHEAAKLWRTEHQKALENKLSTVLSADQLEQFKQHRAEMKEKREQRKAMKNNQNRIEQPMGMQGRNRNCNPPPRN